MKLEDIFSGELELTASERGYLNLALSELYMTGKARDHFKGHKSRDLMQSVGQKIASLRLTKMVTPDGKRLVSVEEHDEIVQKLCTK